MIKLQSFISLIFVLQGFIAKGQYAHPIADQDKVHSTDANKINQLIHTRLDLRFSIAL